MKRDLDLCRQLLADIENHGPDCAVTGLRPGVSGEAEETVRYHIRLLIDGGFVKEVERPSATVPCVRLTNAGHELLELSASEGRWREAKWVVGERTGTQSLTVIKSVLTRWASEAALYGEAWRPRRAYRTYRPTTRSYFTRVEPRYRFERDVEPTVEPRVTTTLERRPYNFLERFDWRAPLDWRDATDRDAYYTSSAYVPATYSESIYRNGLYRDNLYREGYRNGHYREAELYDLEGATLPTHVV